MTILRNSAKCLLCGDEIESKHVHDFVTCSCGQLSVDGGKQYLKRCYSSLDEWEDTSEVTTAIKDLFDERSISIGKFAENNDITPVTLYKLTTGKADMDKIRFSTAKKIADGLNMSLDELYSRTIG